jgi:uncharacterized protein
MTVELRPLGVRCNLRCEYCYQNPQRDAHNLGSRYDIEAMKQAIEKEGGPFTLFGGEALLVPAEDLAQLWAWGLERYGRNGVQTNGVLIEDLHVDLFRRYNVHVGFSLDGPGPLNDARWSGSLERTRETTRRSEENLERLCREGISTSLIVTLHRGNATAEKLPILRDWLLRMKEIGLRSVRLHLLEVEDEDVRRKLALSAAENVEALGALADLDPALHPMRLDLYADMAQLLSGQDKSAACVYRACDPYTTQAVCGVEGRGQRSNCGRTNKDGIDFVKGDAAGYERYIALYHTPQEYGGCRGCRFFLMCKGHCPGTALDRDWRNRTEHCEEWKSAFTRVESGMLARGERPLSLRPERPAIEAAMLRAWACGDNPGLRRVIERLQATGELPAPPGGTPGSRSDDLEGTLS